MAGIVQGYAPHAGGRGGIDPPRFVACLQPVGVRLRERGVLRWRPVDILQRLKPLDSRFAFHAAFRVVDASLGRCAEACGVPPRPVTANSPAARMLNAALWSPAGEHCLVLAVLRAGVDTQATSPLRHPAAVRLDPRLKSWACAAVLVIPAEQVPIPGYFVLREGRTRWAMSLRIRCLAARRPHGRHRGGLTGASLSVRPHREHFGAAWLSTFI